jgi:hypothetical protein
MPGIQAMVFAQLMGLSIRQRCAASEDKADFSRSPRSEPGSLPLFSLFTGFLFNSLLVKFISHFPAPESEVPSCTYI